MRARKGQPNRSARKPFQRFVTRSIETRIPGSDLGASPDHDINPPGPGVPGKDRVVLDGKHDLSGGTVDRVERHFGLALPFEEFDRFRGQNSACGQINASEWPDAAHGARFPSYAQQRKNGFKTDEKFS